MQHENRKSAKVCRIGKVTRVTPVLHAPPAPHLAGHSRGRRPRDYGPGRVCARPGCGTVLRRTHAGPLCDPCEDNGRRDAVTARDRVHRYLEDNRGEWCAQAGMRVVSHFGWP